MQNLRSSLPDTKAHCIFWPIALIGLAADLWTKHAVFEWLPAKGGSVEIIDGFVRFVMTLNTGAAFGIIPGRRYLLIATSTIALLGVLAFFLFGKNHRKILQFAFGLLAAGIAGNLWDRLFNDGSVRDFIDIVYWPGRHWPAFNIADALLCIAVALIALLTFITPRPAQTHAQQQK